LNEREKRLYDYIKSKAKDFGVTHDDGILRNMGKGQPVKDSDLSLIVKRFIDPRKHHSPKGTAILRSRIQNDPFYKQIIKEPHTPFKRTTKASQKAKNEFTPSKWKAS